MGGMDEFMNQTEEEVPSEDHINLPDEVKESEDAEQEEYDRRQTIKDKINALLSDLSPIIRKADADNIRALMEDSELSDIIDYMHDNIPEVKDYLDRGNLGDLTDDDKLAVIENGLKTRAQAIYAGRNIVRNYAPSLSKRYCPSRKIRRMKNKTPRITFFK